MSDRTIEQIKKLLDRAHHTATPEGEADTARDKAYALIAQHHITDAELAAAGQQQDNMTTVTVTLLPPYTKQKSALAVAVSRFTGTCVTADRPVPGQRGMPIVFLGYRSDVTRTTVLFGSLAAQMDRELSRARPQRAGENLAAFRRSWILGFVNTARDRMDAIKQAAEDGAGNGTELVLRDRTQAVEDEFRRRYPHARAGQTRSRGSGYGQGGAAGRRADLGRTSVRGGSRALPR